MNNLFYIIIFKFKNDCYNFKFLKFGITKNYLLRKKQIINNLPEGCFIEKEIVFNRTLNFCPNVFETEVKKKLSEKISENKNFNIKNIFPFPISNNFLKEMSSISFLLDIQNLKSSSSFFKKEKKDTEIKLKMNFEPFVFSF